MKCNNCLIEMDRVGEYRGDLGVLGSVYRCPICEETIGEWYTGKRIFYKRE